LLGTARDLPGDHFDSSIPVGANGKLVALLALFQIRLILV
jgi:hypothetical protein